VQIDYENVCFNEDVEQELLKWFKKARYPNIPLWGALVREKSREICISNGVGLKMRSDGHGYGDFENDTRVKSVLVNTYFLNTNRSFCGPVEFVLTREYCILN